jgi:branched-chain amino acid transport system substrate-binding protein
MTQLIPSFRKLAIGLLLLVLAVGTAVVIGCGSAATEDGGSAASGEPIKIGFNEGFTGFMAQDAMLVEHGILLAMDQAGNKVAGRPLEYVKADNNSDPTQAVAKAKQQVESDGICVMMGPQYSPSAAAVSAYLARAGGIPQLSVYTQPADNLKTANGLAFMLFGIYGREGQIFGKYCAEELGFKTAYALNYEDTASRAIQAGFNEGFTEAGGKVVKEDYVPPDTVDFSSYLGGMPKVDCVTTWVYGAGMTPFIKQYRDYGIKAQLVTPTAGNVTADAMKELGDLAAGIIGLDLCSTQWDDPVNQQFVKDYGAKWDGEVPTVSSYTGYIATSFFLEAVKMTNGDTTPEPLKKALAATSITGPTGKVSVTSYDEAYVGTINLFIVETKKVGDGVAWVPSEVIEQVPLTPLQ